MLADRLLRNRAISEYVLLDFSEAMHDLARDRLGDEPRARYVTRDFRQPDWADGLGLFDAVVTLQAAHEARHRRRLPDILAATRTLLRPGGAFLYCDHYAEAMNGVALYVGRDE
jgi:SAM-dependent methyltransferase